MTEGEESHSQKCYVQKFYQITAKGTREKDCKTGMTEQRKRERARNEFKTTHLCHPNKSMYTLRFFMKVVKYIILLAESIFLCDPMQCVFYTCTFILFGLLCLKFRTEKANRKKKKL